MRKQAEDNDNKISQREVGNAQTSEELKFVQDFNALRKYQIDKDEEVCNLESPDIKNPKWIGKNDGHTQGVAICENYLVLTSNQKNAQGWGYVALCEQVGKYVYTYRSHLGELGSGSSMNKHPGGVQIFKDGGKIYVVVPFESSLKGKKSQIRFYEIRKVNKIPKLVGPILVVNRKGKKAGSVGITDTEQSNKFILAVADDDNQVDFYKIFLRNNSLNKNKLFSSLPKDTSLPEDKRRIKFVNSFSLFRKGNNYYLLCLEGVLKEWWCLWKKVKDRACLYKIDLSDSQAKEVYSSGIVCFGKDIGKGLGDPSFRWGGNSILKDGELSLIATDRSIRGRKDATKGKAKIRIVRPKNNTPTS